MTGPKVMTTVMTLYTVKLFSEIVVTITMHQKNVDIFIKGGC